jgi:hypothetical protein
MRQDVTSEPAIPSPRPAVRARKRRLLFGKTTMQRAVVEALAIFVAGRLIGAVPLASWPDAVMPLITVPLVRMVLLFSPPIWAALRVVSTKREKMSRRFWTLGPRLAAYCALADAIIALLLGDASLIGGPIGGGSDLARFSAHGAAHLAPGGYVQGEVRTLFLLGVYYTIAVVCTRLANGGFLRFTMPTGNGRVTL